MFLKIRIKTFRSNFNMQEKELVKEANVITENKEYSKDE